MNITKTFSLEPTVKSGVYYVVWSATSIYAGTNDYRILQRWRTFSRKHRAGKDALGSHYHSKAHATQTIRDFKKAEDERRVKLVAKEAAALGTPPG